MAEKKRINPDELDQVNGGIGIDKGFINEVKDYVTRIPAVNDVVKNLEGIPTDSVRPIKDGLNHSGVVSGGNDEKRRI